MDTSKMPLEEEIDHVAQTPFLSKTTFSTHIEKMVLNDGFNYIEAVIAFADEADKEPESLVQYMTPVLIEKIQRCAINEGHVRDKGTMQLDSFQ